MLVENVVIKTRGETPKKAFGYIVVPIASTVDTEASSAQIGRPANQHDAVSGSG